MTDAPIGTAELCIPVFTLTQVNNGELPIDGSINMAFIETDVEDMGVRVPVGLPTLSTSHSGLKTLIVFTEPAVSTTQRTVSLTGGGISVTLPLGWSPVAYA